MLDIDFKPTFTRLVTVSIPSGASSVEQSFTATFQALDVPEFNSFDLTTVEGISKFLERVFVGADDVVDGGGNPVAFTAELRRRLIALPWARPALVTAYIRGFGQAAEGN